MQGQQGCIGQYHEHLSKTHWKKMKKPLPAEFTVYMRRYTVGTILICICDTFLDRECFGEYSNIYSNRREYDVVNSAHIFRLHVHQFRQFRRSYLQIYVHSFFTIPQSTFNKKIMQICGFLLQSQFFFTLHSFTKWKHDEHVSEFN